MLLKTESYEEAITLARVDEADKVDYAFRWSQLSDFDVENFTVRAEGAEYKFTEHALSQFLAKLRIPEAYFKLCSRELRQEEVDEAWPRLKLGDGEQYLRLRGNDILGIVPRNYNLTRTADIFNAVHAGVRQALPEVEFSEIQITDTASRMRVIDKSVKFNEALDVFHPALDFSFSEVGAQGFKAVPGIYRLVCSNGQMMVRPCGATFNMSMTKFTTPQLGTYFDGVSAPLMIMGRKYAEVFEGLGRIPTPKNVLDVEDSPLSKELATLFKRICKASVVSEVGGALAKEYETADDNSVKGILNAITATARDNEAMKVPLEYSVGNVITSMLDEKTIAEAYGVDFQYTMPMLERALTPSNRRRL